MADKEPTPQKPEPTCILPHPDVQRFLLELIDQSSFKGQMSEFVSGVKEVIRTAEILNQS